MRGVALGVALGLVISIVVSCGGAPPSPDLNEKLRKENEITALWTQIREFRRDAKMPLDPPRSLQMQFRASPVDAVKRVCTDGHEVPKTCDDVCDLSDAICDNAEAICGIAADLGKDDTFAQDKCASAKASCREAKQRCCDCSGGVQ
ncbi:MAG: hypothetical protein JO257_36450 [Deltaproteobacteria bacterium]|nr:hypothetical protein [Deltaproteobacteria bacterium]